MKNEAMRMCATALVAVGLLWVTGARAQTVATSAALQVRLPNGQRSNLPLIDEDVDVVIDQQHATTKLRHMYHNKTARRLEGQFTLRVGGDAMVHGFAYWNGAQKIVGEVFEKALATKIYDDTVNQRRDPGLLTKTGEGIFAFKVFPIEADEHKRIEMRVDEWLPRHANTVEYRVPVTRGDVDVRIEILDSRSIGRVVSSSHRLNIERAQGRVVVTSEGVRGTRSELVLRYELLDAPWTISAALHRDADHDGYLMLSLPAPKANRSIAKDVTLVIDRSGSMLGAPLKHAKLAATHIVDKLANNDRFNVVVFSSSVQVLFSGPMLASDKTRQRARSFIDGLGAGGGTNIALALTSAFDRQHRGKRPKMVLFLTDGKSDSRDALLAAKADTGDVRLFTIGLGSKVEKPLLSRLAASKRGTFTYVESAATLKTRMARLFSNISAPALVGLTLRVEGEGASLYRVYPTSLPDVFNGGELRVLSRVQGRGDIKVVLEGRTANGPIKFERTISVPTKVRRRWVGRLWANARVAHLLEEMALHGETLELRRETQELGLAYNLMTPYTAFLAIPESELTSRGSKLLAAARDQRQDALAFNPDAAALQNPGAAMPAEHVGMAPPHPEMSAPPQDARGVWGGRGGCASCMLGGSDAPAGADVAMWLLLAVGIRRRRTRRGTRAARG